MADPAGAAALPVLAEQFKVPGLQLATWDGATTSTFEYGQRVAGGPDPVGADTRFPLGSVMKLVIATLVLQLADDGDLDLDAPLSARMRDLGALGAVTPRALLSHTSGLPDLPGGGPGAGAGLRRHVYAAAAEPPVCEPGFFSYSNFGFVVLCHLIEVVHGIGWIDAARTFLLGPLGAADPDLRAVETGEHAVHLPTGTVAAVVEPDLPAVVVAAGLLSLSAADLLRVAAAHCQRSAVLDPETAASMRAPVGGADPFGVAAGYGLGVASYGGGWFGHDGNTGGATCTVRFHPEQRRALVLQTNATSGWWLAERFLADLDVGTYRPPVPTGRLRGADLKAAADELTGTYRSGDRVVEVTLGGTGDLLFAGKPIALYEDLVFRLDAADGAPQAALADDFRFVHRFLRSPRTGAVSGLQFGGARVLARRCP